MNKTFTFHVDPGHGWLEVTIDDLKAVGLLPLDFTSYSYRSWDGKTLYLEEHEDASRFAVAWKAMHGDINVPYVEKYTSGESPIRKLLHNSVDAERRVAAS